ncbi:MAG: CopD family protein [Longimicrobiales bacterium]
MTKSRETFRFRPWLKLAAIAVFAFVAGGSTRDHTANTISAVRTATALHDRLVRSEPAQGDTLDVVPTTLRLTFSRAVTLDAARVSLAGPGGAVELRTLALEPDSPAIVLAAITGRVTAGQHQVVWQILGEDGHPVHGEFTFVIAPDAAGLAPTDEPAPPAPAPAAGAAASAIPTFGPESPLYVAVRWLWFASLIGVLGVVTFRLAVLGRAARSDATLAGVVPAAAALAAKLGVAFAAVALAAAVLRLFAQQSAAGVEASVLLGATTWGRGWILHVLAATAALAGLWIARTDRRPGWLLAVPATVALAFAPALSGHAVATDPVALSVVADALHVIGAGGWLGTLMLILFAGIPIAFRAGEHRDRIVAGMVRAFSPLALVFAGILAATGVFSAWQHVGSWGALFGSDYGQALLLKLGALVLVLTLGAYNFLRLKPHLPNEAITRRLRRSAGLELAMAALVILLTAILVATPTPTENEPVAHVTTP